MDEETFEGKNRAANNLEIFSFFTKDHTHSKRAGSNVRTSRVEKGLKIICGYSQMNWNKKENILIILDKLLFSFMMV